MIDNVSLIILSLMGSSSTSAANYNWKVPLGVESLKEGHKYIHILRKKG